MHFVPCCTLPDCCKLHCIKKIKGSSYSITERRVPELIPVLGSQPAGDVSHKPGGRLPLLSVRPAVTPATLKRAASNFAAWWTKARWVWTVCLRLLSDSVAAAIWTRAFCAWFMHAIHSVTEPPLHCIGYAFLNFWSKDVKWSKVMHKLYYWSTAKLVRPCAVIKDCLRPRCRLDADSWRCDLHNILWFIIKSS